MTDLRTKRSLFASGLAAILFAAVVDAVAQATLTFDKVSIRRVVASAARTLPTVESPVEEQTDGGMVLTNISVSALIARAYPTVAVPRVNLPEWTRRELYDVRATSSLRSATANDRVAMLRAMLADRFKLAVRFEKRVRPVFNLLLAKPDGALGPGLRPIDVPCPSEQTASGSTAVVTGKPSSQILDFKSPPRRCTLRIVDARTRDRHGDKQGRSGDLLEGEATIATLAEALSLSARRPVVDKTRLKGTYRVAMNFNGALPRLPKDVVTAPSVFRAVEDQLGLKLESWAALEDFVVIDRLERPAED